MTISEAMARLDHARPGNLLGDEEKLQLLSELDMKVWLEVLKPRLRPGAEEDPDYEEFTGYTPDVDPQEELLIADPYSRCYRFWMESQLDYEQGEVARYNNSSAAFNAEFQEYVNWINRNHPARQLGPFNV